MKLIYYEDIKYFDDTKLIKLSIQKWKDIRDGIAIDQGRQNCALCTFYRSNAFCITLTSDQVNINLIHAHYNAASMDVFPATFSFKLYKNTDNPLCFGCPIQRKTNQNGCQGTPYVNYHTHIMYSASCTIHKTDFCVECNELATEMIEFLKSLL